MNRETSMNFGFGRKRVVVTSRRELVEAFRNPKTREINVCGNDDLRALAVQLATSQGRQNSQPARNEEWKAERLIAPLPAERLFAPLPPDTRRRASDWLYFGAAGCLLVILTLIVIAIRVIRERLMFHPPPHAVGTGLAYEWADRTTSGTIKLDGLEDFGWIAIGLVALAVVYRLVMRAMEGDRDVELKWRVTERITGQLIIKKAKPERRPIATQPQKS
jgi:hypothetical protein